VRIKYHATCKIILVMLQLNSRHYALGGQVRRTHRLCGIYPNTPQVRQKTECCDANSFLLVTHVWDTRFCFRVWFWEYQFQWISFLVQADDIVYYLNLIEIQPELMEFEKSFNYDLGSNSSLPNWAWCKKKSYVLLKWLKFWNFGWKIIDNRNHARWIGDANGTPFCKVSTAAIGKLDWADKYQPEKKVRY
jgi:hypothetical protein